MSYTQIVAEDRRLVTLRLLEQSNGYSGNEYLLASALPGFGHQVSADQVRTDFAWLQEQGLIEVKNLGNVQVATLTQRGVDVACGRARQPGVKRPGPDS